jgi:hypothetical protein
MKYGDGEVVELGDTVEVNEEPDKFEPEEATVIKIGKQKIQVKFTNLLVKYRKIWVSPQMCELIRREG